MKTDVEIAQEAEIQDIRKIAEKLEISEDELKDYEDRVQKITDKYIEKIDSTVDNKSKEIMTV